MKKVIIFNTEKEAMDWDWHHNKLTGSDSTFLYNRIPLKETTTLTKSEYAELYNISATVSDEEGEDVANPNYTELQNSYTLHKYALEVGDDLTKYDEEGNFIGYGCKHCNEPVDVVELDESLVYIQEEE